MKKRTLLALLCILVSTVSFAQEKVNIPIKGQLIDSLTNETVAYATVKLSAKEKPETPIKAVPSDDNGKFAIYADLKGEYILVAEFIGKNTVTIPITVGDKPSIDLGKLNMADDSKVLSEIEVSAQKPLVKVELDKITYSMEDDPESKTNNVLDMLKKVPMITVDGEENIQLNGSTSYKIYLNGKPSNMIASNPKDVLKSMPANTIKNIEVITDPGAKYDAEGVTGIINIITQKNTSMNGYTMNVNGRVDSDGGYGAGIYAMTKYEKVGFTGNFNNYSYRNPGGDSYSHTTRTADVKSKYLSETGSTKSKGDGIYGNGELSYEIDTLNLITVAGGTYGGSWSEYGKYSEVWSRDKNNKTDYKYGNNSYSEEGYGGTDVNADYQRTSAKVKDRLLTVSYRLSMSPSDRDRETGIAHLEGDKPEYIKYGNRRQGTNGDMYEHTAQIDFTTPLNKIHSIEAGAKLIYRLNKSDSEYEMLDENGNWKIDDEPTIIGGKPIYRDNGIDQFKHDNKIMGAYAGYNAKLSKWGFKTGLRYEGTWQKVRFPLATERDFKSDYNNLIPSATITYQLKPMQNIRLAYNLRINRPGIWNLNPYLDNSDPNNISYGNPELDAVKSHNISLNHGFFNPKLNINTNLSYNFHNNGIEQITKAGVNVAGDPITETTYANIGKSKRVNLSTYVNWSPNDKWRIYSNMGVGYMNVKANDGTNLSNNGYNGRISGGLQFSIPSSKWFFNANAGYFSAYKTLQTKGTNQHYNSFSVRKSLINDKLNISTYINNPFQTSFTYKNRTYNDNFYRETGSTFKQRRVGINISYRFGEMKSQIKKAQRGINNDDVSGGGGQGGGNQGGGGGQGG